MNGRERDICDRLERSAMLKTERDFDEFRDSAKALAGGRDPDVLRRMLSCLRDVDAGEIQYELVEACESFPRDVYVKTLIEAGPAIAKQAGQWWELLFQSMLNTEELARKAQQELQKVNSAARKFYIRLLRKLSAESRQ